MGRIPAEIVEDVLERTDILQIVQQYVTLKRAGTNHKGLCPFHSEKTPSFNVHAGKGIFKCFGCGAAGNVYRFLMDLEGWNFPETVRHLAGRVGIEIPEESEEEAQEARKKQEAQKLYRRIMGLARAFYEENLWGEHGERARAYLKERGIDEETARTFGLGYAPQGWQNALDMLEQKGLNSQLVERAGLAISRHGGDGFYDRFRDRIMFPVIDNWGHTLAFGGRVLPGDDAPKYINSSETRFYSKGKNLFGLHAAKQGIQRAEYALLVEGNFDVVVLHARGYTMAVAPMGTAFTETQARLLKRYAAKIVVAFDGDGAGEEATVRALPALERVGLESHVMRFAREDDPDSFIRREGAASFEARVQAAPPLIGWALERVLPDSENVPVEERLKSLEEAAKILEHVREPIVWKHYAEDLSRRLNIEARLFKRYLKRPEASAEEIARQFEASGKAGKEDDIKLDGDEFTLMVLLFKHPEWLNDFLGEQLDNLLKSAELVALLHAARELMSTHEGKLEPGLLLEQIEHQGWRRRVADALTSSSNDLIEEELASHILKDIDEKEAQVYEDLVRHLKLSWGRRSLDEVLNQIEELGKDFAKNRDALVQANEQKKQLEQFCQQHKVTPPGTLGMK